VLIVLTCSTVSTLALTSLSPLLICAHLLLSLLLTLPTFDSPWGSPSEGRPGTGVFVGPAVPLLILSTL
jgi:hypothetical protein